jgi:hypothetical protein
MHRNQVFEENIKLAENALILIRNMLSRIRRLNLDDLHDTQREGN